MNPTRCPWHVPAPVRPGRFVPLRAADADLNVEVDLGALGAYRCQPTPDEPLLADLQTCPGASLPGRLGAGRAGLYRGRYLKGVGRTPLAAPLHGSPVHHSGHLPASAALREHVVSRYLASRHLTRTIVPCEGLLFAPLPAALAGFQERAYRGCAPDALPIIDRHFIALSVKPGGFARPSNFLWLLHHLTPGALCPEHSVEALATLLGAALCPERTPASLDPAGLGAALARAVERAGEHFCVWARAGVHWLSLSNNLTIDGRFLDLETPLITATPFVGVLSEAEEAPRSALLGCEYFSYLAQTRAFCQALVHGLQLPPEGLWPIEREFAVELAAQIEARLLHPESPLRSREAAVAVLTPALAQAQGATPARLAMEYAARNALGDGAVEGAFAVVPGLPRLRAEPGRVLRLYAPGPAARALPPLAGALAEHLHALDRCASLDAVSDELGCLERTLTEWGHHDAQR